MGNLMPETTSFVGRGSELRAVADAVADARLVTLTGVGGVGKTRLARHAGEGLRDAFPDGVWLVGLSPLYEPAMMGLAVYEALRLADQTTRPAIDVVTDWLADKKLLLILDCCEHLAPGCADFVRTLMTTAPGVRVLATSRHPLGVADEHVVAVPPLPVAPHGSQLSDAARLFMERADAAAPSAVLAGKDGAAVAEICARLEGIPLAIELAAARLQEMDLDLLRQRLHARFETLTARGTWDGEVEHRHQALRTTIGWSHELCAPLERLAWARLSVFSGGLEQEAAEWVCAGGPLGVEQVAGVLSSLADKSVLQHTKTPRGTRYSMLDTVREYGHDWLRGLDEDQSLAERHRDYYRWLARLSDREWIGPGQFAWSDRLTAEHANLLVAMESCLADPDPRRALGMAGHLWFFWVGCGHQREGRHYLDRALARDSGPGPERFWALWACGYVVSVQGDAEAATAVANSCTPMANQLGDQAMIGAARFLEGQRLTLVDQSAGTVALIGKAPRSPAFGGGSPRVRLLALGITAFAHLQLGQFDPAAEDADALRKECEQHGEQWLRGYALYFLATAALGNGDAAAAVTYARDALAIKWRLRDIIGTALTLDTLVSAVAAADPEQAVRLLGIADTLWHTNSPPQMGVPALIGARRACEQRLRDAIGNAAYGTAHREGRESTIDDGIAYALHRD